MKSIFQSFFEYFRKTQKWTATNSKIYYFFEPKTAFNEIEIYLN